ncbi:transposase [Dyadobacter sp. CY356]|uniref:transposase n=1 Tax=Dyadobacter sp. CY356 TaxID=2906442 RepID=UPI001F218847|nr:transposase [Dyadobacter sp. CY356]MCF0058845.1 transposase [Dyadobacter sp. CY356]
MSYYDPKIHHRRSIRLDTYDYSQEGLYFVTCCCQDREYFFGEIINSELILNEAGKLIEQEWMNLSDRFLNIRLHDFVIMPNHFHAILELVGATLVVARNSPDIPTSNHNFEEKGPGRPQGITPTDTSADTQVTAPTIGDIISAFKSITTVKYIHGVKTANWPKFNKRLWQRNYYEHIIRNEIALNNIANYIIENPKRWNEDRFR